MYPTRQLSRQHCKLAIGVHELATDLLRIADTDCRRDQQMFVGQRKQDEPDSDRIASLFDLQLRRRRDVLREELTSLRPAAFIEQLVDHHPDASFSEQPTRCRVRLVDTAVANGDDRQSMAVA